MAGYQIPSDCTDYIRSVFNQDFGKGRLRIAFVNHYQVLSENLNEVLAALRFIVEIECFQLLLNIGWISKL